MSADCEIQVDGLMARNNWTIEISAHDNGEGNLPYLSGILSAGNRSEGNSNELYM